MVTAEPVYLDQSRAAKRDQLGAEPDGKPAESSSGGESLSLTSAQSEHAEPDRSPSSSSELADDEHEDGAPPIRCSAVHTLERDMPDYDYSAQVVELRQRILEHAQQNPGTYSPVDLDKCRRDNWFLSRFLLRQKMDLDEACEMLKRALRFNHESLANHLRPEDFPAEFYQLGGMIPYGHDRKGNKMLYLRIRVHKKTPEITSIVQAFIYYNIKRLDDEAQGKGISIVIDCTGAGLANADMDTLLFLITTLKNYFPKGLSYFLVHELPWILKPFWHIAKAWIPQEHRQLIKFSDSSTVNEYIHQTQLPDFMGGQVRECDYKRVPKDCVLLEQAAKMWGIDKRLIGRVLAKFREDLPAETVARIEDYFSLNDDEAGDDDGEAARRADDDGERASGRDWTRNQMFSN